MRLVVLYILLAVLLLVILAVFAVPHGVDVAYSGGQVRVGLKAGPLRLPVFPKKELTGKKLERAQRRKAARAARKEAKKAAKERAAAKKQKDQTQAVKPKKTMDPELLLALAQMGTRAMGRFFRSFTIDRLELRYVVATGDPYNTAVAYSWLCAGIAALPALAWDRIRVRHRDVEIGMDFTGEKPEMEGRIAVSLCLGRLVGVGAVFAWEFIQWKSKHRREKSPAAAERKSDDGREQDQRTHGRDDDQAQAAG